MLRLAAAYQRDAKIYIMPENKTMVGLQIQVDPVATCIPSDLVGLERAIKRALSLSQIDVPEVDFSHWGVNDSPAQRVAGVKKWKEFVVGTKCVAIEARDQVRFLPSRNRGARFGFEPIPERQVLCSDQQSLAPKLLEAFDNCF